MGKILNLPKQGSFWRQLAKIVLGTTISLLVTIIAAQLLESRQRAKDRKLGSLTAFTHPCSLIYVPLQSL